MLITFFYRLKNLVTLRKMSHNESQSVTPKNDRLPSLRPPRDLTLAGSGTNGPTFGSTKSKFTPNLAVAGKRQSPQISDAQRNSDGNRGARGHGRGRGRGSSRGRGKHEPEIIQSKGIFSDGFSETASKTSSTSRDYEGGSGGGFGGTGGGVRSGLSTSRRTEGNGSSENVNQPGIKYEPMETDEVALSGLFKDNFISDLNDGDIRPILLPFSDFKTEHSHGFKLESSLKPERIDEQSIFDETFSEIENAEGSFLFLQLPSILSDMLSNNVANVENPKREIKAEVESEEIDKPTTSVEKKEDIKKRSVFENVPEGRFGKLQLLKSGQMRLKLMTSDEDQPIYFDVNLVPTSFAQQLVSIQCDNPELNEGSMNVIGDKVLNKMLVTPNVERIVQTLKQ